MSLGDPRAGSPGPHCTDEAAGGTMDETGSPGRPRTLSLGRAGIALARPHFSRQSQARERLAGQRGVPAEQHAHRGPSPPSPRRDARRAEELCAKNRQLREQQRALKENLRALENRWGT